MYRLKFSYNWNNKLDCRAFTTIRIFNPTQHIVGNKVAIELLQRGNIISKGVGTIMCINRFLLDQMNPFISFIDTGYSVEECKSILHKMHPNIDFNIYKLALILVVKDKPAATGSSN